MRYCVAHRPAITQHDKDYPYYVTIVGTSSIHNWKRTARSLKLNNVHEFVKFLKDRYDVSIRVNWGPRYQQVLGLNIDFKLEEQAQDLVNICNGGK